MYLLRSMLFVPAHVQKFMESAAKYDADCLILDIEDSVPDREKDNARNNIKQALMNNFFGDRQIIVRINSLDTALTEKDIAQTMHPRLLGYMPSKVYSNEDIIKVTEYLGKYEYEYKYVAFKLLPLIETTESIFNVHSIAKSSPRLIALCFGNEDLVTDLHGESDAELRTLEVPRFLVCAAARAAGIEPIDTVFLDVKNDAAFQKREEFAKRIGYAGTLCLHPSQIAVANECFSPSLRDIEKSKKIVDAILKSTREGRSITLLDGKVIGPPMIKKAYKILEQVEAIKEIECPKS